MLPDRVSNPGPLTYESDALPIALRGPARQEAGDHGQSRRKPNKTDSFCRKRKLADSFIPCAYAFCKLSDQFGLNVMYGPK